MIVIDRRMNAVMSAWMSTHLSEKGTLAEKCKKLNIKWQGFLLSNWVLRGFFQVIFLRKDLIQIETCLDMSYFSIFLIFCLVSSLKEISEIFLILNNWKFVRILRGRILFQTISLSLKIFKSSVLFRYFSIIFIFFCNEEIFNIQ